MIINSKAPRAGGLSCGFLEEKGDFIDLGYLNLKRKARVRCAEDSGRQWRAARMGPWCGYMLLLFRWPPGQVMGGQCEIPPTQGRVSHESVKERTHRHVSFFRDICAN